MCDEDSWTCTVLTLTAARFQYVFLSGIKFREQFENGLRLPLNVSLSIENPPTGCDVAPFLWKTFFFLSPTLRSEMQFQKVFACMINKMFLRLWSDHKFWTFLCVVLCDCAMVGCYGDELCRTNYITPASVKTFVQNHGNRI